MSKERIRKNVSNTRSRLVEALYWRKQSLLSYVSEKKLADIYLEIAKEQIIKEVTEKEDLWKKEGLEGLKTIIRDYAYKMQTYAYIAANKGIQEPFEVAYHYALTVLDVINKEETKHEFERNDR